MSERRFERLTHTVYGGYTMDLPLLIHPEHGLDDDSVALLHAADIIGGNPDTYENDLTVLLEELGCILEVGSDSSAGIIIEDELGAGSISVHPQETEVMIQALNKTYKIPTILLFDTVYAWVHEEYYGIDDSNTANA